MQVKIEHKDKLYEQRLDDEITGISLFSRLELVTGVPHSQMQIFLYRNNDFIREIKATEEKANISSNSVLRVKGETEIIAVEKYEISDSSYSSLENSFRKFKQNLTPLKPLNKFDENLNFKITEKCVVVTPSMRKLATIVFIGKVYFSDQIMYGVEYDEPLGKHDGEFQGKRYFKCKQLHGAFVKPSCCEIPLEEDLNFYEEI